MLACRRLASQRLSIEVTERVIEYALEVHAQWRDAAWWDAEGWRDVLPETEWHRALTHFRTQAVRGGYHFVEVLYMQAVESEGLNFQYEGYDFFEPPSHTSAGYAKVLAAFGERPLARLHDAASRYRLAYGDLPATPDIFVYREDGGEVTPVRFVEVKHNDVLRPRQLLGLALIQDVLEAPIEVVRFIPAGTRRAARTYRREWPRGAFIRTV